jgi:hypothetical protein
MAFQKRFKNDFVLVENFKTFINALFNDEKPNELLNETTTKAQIIKFFAGAEYESFDDFEHEHKIIKKRAAKKNTISEFLKTHNLEMYPHSAYSIFLNEEKSAYEKKHPEVSLTELRKIMTEDWHKMNESKKESFSNKFNQHKQEFIDKVMAIDPTFVGNFDKSKAPKGPMRPYNVYVKEQMKIIKAKTPSVNSTEIMKEIGQSWKALTDAEKKKYYDICGETPKDPSTKPAPKSKKTVAPKADVDTDDEASLKAKPTSKPKATKEKPKAEEKPAAATEKPKAAAAEKPKAAPAEKPKAAAEEKPKAAPKGKKTIVTTNISDSDSDVPVSSAVKAKGKKVVTTSDEESESEPVVKKTGRKLAASKIDEILDDEDA